MFSPCLHLNASLQNTVTLTHLKFLPAVCHIRTAILLSIHILFWSWSPLNMAPNIRMFEYLPFLLAKAGSHNSHWVLGI